jgi:hypothetical protein
MLDRNGKKDTIKEILTGLLKQNVGVRFELEPAPEPEPAEPQAEPAVRRSAPPPAAAPAPVEHVRVTPEMKEALRADPLVAAVMRYLNGEIVKVE